VADSPGAVPTTHDTLAAAKSRIAQLEESWEVAAETTAATIGAAVPEQIDTDRND
jgi:hypothetical protein